MEKRDLLGDNIALRWQLDEMQFGSQDKTDQTAHDNLVHACFIVTEALKHGNRGLSDYDCLFRQQRPGPIT